MLLEFTKMNGAGNDFIFLDNRAGEIRLTLTAREDRLLAGARPVNPRAYFWD